MIILVGIGHVFSIKKAVKKIINERQPDAVCVELDKMRFDILEKGLRDHQEGPFLMKRLQKIYDKAAEMQGASVGEEMLGAVEAAREMGIPYFFIDIEASPMVANLLEGLSIGEKMKLAGSVLTASVLPKRQMENGLKKIEEDPEFAMEQFEKAFPTLKRDIVDYRDKYMAERLKRISGNYETIIAIIGEGHMAGLSDHLKGYEVDKVHLKEVMEIAREAEEKSKDEDIYTETEETSNTRVNFSFDVEVR